MQELLDPAPHPFKAEFKKLGISQLKLSYNLQITNAYLNHLLNGYIPMPPKRYQQMSEILHSYKHQQQQH